MEDNKAAAYIKEKMEEYGLDAHLEAFSFETITMGTGKKAGMKINITTSNVIGIKEGASDQIIIIGAHYDTSCPDCPGADDNAGGVAVMLEVARELQNESFNRTLYFVAFSGEEFGLLGSESWLEKHEDLRDNIVAMINLDCVAYGDKLLMSSPSRWLLDVFPPKANIDKRESTAPFPSDEWRFLEENLPFVRLCDLGSHVFWDTPDDTIAILNFSLAKESAEIVANGVYNLAATNDLTPPEVSVEVENGTVYYKVPEESTIQVFVDGMDLGYIESGKIRLPAGEHHVKVTDTDNMGNRASDELIVNVNRTHYVIPTFEGESVVIIPWKRPEEDKPDFWQLSNSLVYKVVNATGNLTITGFLDGIKIDDLEPSHFVVLTPGKHTFKVVVFNASGIVGFDEETFRHSKSYSEPFSYPSQEEEPNIAILLTIAAVLVIAAISFLIVKKVKK
ncbi:MAG: M20/M25/M40 family metallo-hydrolase [Methanophagales archaeon]|nr:M20/M25/M40 family metallo-hydrolase [Methanophagales archaeon]